MSCRDMLHNKSLVAVDVIAPNGVQYSTSPEGILAIESDFYMHTKFILDNCFDHKYSTLGRHSLCCTNVSESIGVREFLLQTVIHSSRVECQGY